MAQHYSNSGSSNTEQASAPGALPDVEVFHRNSCFVRFGLHGGECGRTFDTCPHVGWYWWLCFPNGLPNGAAHGPFATEAEARADAQSNGESEEEQ